ncbi:MAG: elongator complex protein 3 [Thermoprotei archaeon]
MLELRVRKPSRMLSGVTIVAVMTHPLPCPGQCIYCPGGIEQGTPKSYYGNEPALRRAIRNNYHPYRQVWNRLKQYEYLGHEPSKIEVIVMGGTFLAAPQRYKEWFISMIFEGLNRYPDPNPPHKWDLEEAQLRNETAKYRCVGLTIETRPDYGYEKHADEMLRYGATRVELGVQSIYEDVLQRIKRGHGVKEVIESTRILRDAGFKIVYHIMPGLPGSDPDRDIEMIREIFENPDFRPDMLKIYPTEVVEGTELYEMWKKGLYKPYDDETAIEVISEMYRYIPKYVRVMRIRRDIPADEVVAGTKKSNLREYVEKRCIEKGIKIREIRFREVGLQAWKYGRFPDPRYTRITRLTYEAGGGIEEFLAVEDSVNDIIIGFLRLRIPSDKAHRPEIDNRTAIVRELHVYGPELAVGKYGFSWQHRGWGRKLLEEAERIAREEYSAKKILVLSGIGVREYYRKLGYYRPPDSPYMHKELS